MRIWTKAEIINKVEADLDLQEEALITAGEMTGYLEEAVEDCEALIHTIDEDYFLARATLALTAGVSVYTLPSNIYASKIRTIMYLNGPLRYSIDRIRSYMEFQTVAEIDLYPSSNPNYRYLLVNQDGPTGVQIELHPVSQETSASNVTIWYLREANRMQLDTDVCDIPEFINYLIAHIKRSCLAKEQLGVAPPEATAMVEKQEKKLLDTLTNRVPDNDDTVQMDMSHYWEHE